MAKRSKPNSADYVWAAARIGLGFTFLWAFFDKLFGLGYATCNVEGVTTVGCSSAWVAGGSPTEGFLTFATSGPLAGFYQSLAGNPLIDWLFMIGLLGIGIGLTFGIAMKLSAYSGVLLLLMMWSATLWPANNPFIDEHIIYAIVLLGLLQINSTQAFGMRKTWANQDFVQRNAWLE